MNPRIKNALYVIASVLTGGILNMAIIMLGSKIIPPPEGAVLTTMEGLKSSMHLMQPKHFLMPFIAHAAGTLAAAFMVVKLVSKNHLNYALGIGVWFLIGGIMNIFMLPSPTWFTIVDLAGAYLPMAFIGYKLALPKH